MNFSDEFQNGETLLRGILNKPDFWKDKENRPSSAAFKDSRGGTSVNRTGKTREYYNESLEQLKTSEKGKYFRAIAEVEVVLCESLELHLKYCPIKDKIDMEDNIYHSEIHTPSFFTKNREKRALQELAKECKIIA